MFVRLAQGSLCVVLGLGCAATGSGEVARAPDAAASAPDGSEAVAPVAFDEGRALEAGERLAMRGLQPGDAPRRREALESAKSALLSGDAAQATAALHALARWNELPFDRAEARALVEPHLAAGEAARRRAAWRALAALGELDGLCARASTLVDDPDPALRADALRLVGAACGGFVEVDAEQAALAALDAARAEGHWPRACRSLRGLPLGARLEARILDAALAGDEDAEVVLEALPAKSRATIEDLLARAPGVERAARLSGACLRAGVAQADRNYVAELALAWWERSSASGTVAREAALALLEAHGSAAEARRLLESCAGDARCERVAALLAAR
jgi:hypothetical protein